MDEATAGGTAVILLDRTQLDRVSQNTSSRGEFQRRGWSNSAWGRFSDKRSTPASGQEFGGQAGFDLWHGNFWPGHRDAAGVYVAYGNTSATVNGLTTNADATGYSLGRTSSVGLDAYSGGVYWTHYGPGAWYVDAVFQGTQYTTRAQTQFATLRSNGNGILPSLEVGYPVPLPALGPGFILEPQGQILYQHVSFGQANDGLGDVSLGGTTGETGRLRGQWSIPGGYGELWQPYVRGNCGATGVAGRRRASQAKRCRWSSRRRGWNLPAG